MLARQYCGEPKRLTDEHIGVSKQIARDDSVVLISN